MFLNRKVNQSKTTAFNILSPEITKFLESNEIVNYREAITSIPEVDENVEVVPREKIMYSDCTDLDRLVKIPDLQNLFLDAEDNKECKMDLLYQLEGLINLSVVYSGDINLGRLYPMRNLKSLFLRQCDITTRFFLPMNLNTLLLEDVHLDNNTMNSLATLELLEKLKITRAMLKDEIISLKFLHNLHNLIHLELNELGDIKSGSSIATSIQLETLILHNTTFSDYSVLTNLTNLTELFLTAKREVANLDWISNLTKLEVLILDLFHNDNNAVEKISEISSIRELYLTNTLITTTEYFTKLNNLTMLVIRGCINLEDFSYLSECNNLREIVIGSQTLPENILSYLTHLESIKLSVEGRGEYDYTPLINNKILTKLNLGIVITDNDDMKIISTISNLEDLAIESEIEVYFDNEGLSHLSKLTRLVNLNISGNDLITDEGLSHLSKLTRLVNLDISRNDSITDEGLSHLSKLEKLETLNLIYCNSFTNDVFTLLSTFPSLKKLSIVTFEEKYVSILRENKPGIIIEMIPSQFEETDQEEPDQEEPDQEETDQEEPEPDQVVIHPEQPENEEDYTPPEWTS